MEWDDQLIDDALRRSVSSLDKAYPEVLPDPAVIWAAIDGKRRRGKIVKIRRALAIAASLAVLLGTATIWYFSQKGDAVPLVKETFQPEPIPAVENEAWEYIRRLCGGNNIVCSSPAFNELQNEFKTASSELSAVNQQIWLYGNDELLLRAKARIENHQARIIKAMVQLL